MGSRLAGWQVYIQCQAETLQQSAVCVRACVPVCVHACVYVCVRMRENVSHVTSAAGLREPQREM